MRFQGCERLDQDMRVRVSRCDGCCGWTGPKVVYLVLTLGSIGDGCCLKGVILRCDGCCLKGWDGSQGVMGAVLKG